MMIHHGNEYVRTLRSTSPFTGTTINVRLREPEDIMKLYEVARLPDVPTVSFDATVRDHFMRMTREMIAREAAWKADAVRRGHDVIMVCTDCPEGRRLTARPVRPGDV